MSTYKTFSLYLEEYCDGCRDFEADIEKIDVSTFGKNHVLQIFVVKMRSDVEKCMNILFSNQGCDDSWERRNLKEKLQILKMT